MEEETAPATTCASPTFAARRQERSRDRRRPRSQLALRRPGAKPRPTRAAAAASLISATISSPKAFPNSANASGITRRSCGPCETLSRRYNEEFYILGIFTLSVLLIVALIAPLVPHHNFAAVIFALFLALVPASQGGVDLDQRHRLRAAPRRIPRKDRLLEGHPDDAHHPGRHPFPAPQRSPGPRALRRARSPLPLQSGPKSPLRPAHRSRRLRRRAFRRRQEPARATWPSRPPTTSTPKYASQRGGKFVLLHRHRVFNARQGVWMGWERKRGKLLDLNKLPPTTSRMPSPSKPVPSAVLKA